jgi:hypothetical protein
MRRTALALAAALAALAADDKGGAGKKALEALQGTWRLQSMTEDGRHLPAD